MRLRLSVWLPKKQGEIVMRLKLAGFVTLLSMISLGAGCARLGFSGGDETPRGPAFFYGVALADEPNAARVARQILEEGGSAADAVTAAYFTLSVTYPTAAGIGGGGICTVFDTSSRKVESVEFLARQPSGGGSFAIPGNVRGFALLQARYGRLAWAQLIAPAEHLAAQGFATPRALVRRLEMLVGDAQVSALIDREYRAQNEGAVREGAILKFPKLAHTLGIIRVNGASAFYEGKLAQTLSDVPSPQGSGLSLNDLAAFRPQIASSSRAMNNINAVFLPPSHLGAGIFAQSLWAQLSRTGLAADANATVDAAALQGLNAFGIGYLPPDFGSTSFLAVDGAGNGVACAVTMGRPLGTGIEANATGIVFAPNPSSGAEGFAGAFLMPVIVTDTAQERLYFAGAGAGVPRASASILYLAANADTSSINDLFATLSGGQTGPINMFSCARGFSAAGGCRYATDTRGSGAAFEAASPARARP